jgi:RNase P subunit RPR2
VRDALPRCDFCGKPDCGHPLIESEGHRLLCPECRSADLEARVTEKRHQVIFRCQRCDRVTFLPLRGR